MRDTFLRWPSREALGREGIPRPRRLPARVVVADDQTVVREGVVMLLGLLPGIEVVGVAADGEEAVRTRPGRGVHGSRMPRCDGVEATRHIRAEHPGTQVVVLMTFGDDEFLFPALRAGARGYPTKDAGGDEILRAVQSVLSGDAGLSPSVQRRLLGRLSEPEPEPAVLVGPPDGLTSRETEVLVLIAEGLDNQQIARELQVSTATVKTHINNMFTKTGLKGRAQEVRYAFRKGLVRPPAG